MYSQEETLEIRSPHVSGTLMDCQIAVIGAGPYGLSAAAHLEALGQEVRVFGEPMEFWSRRMPTGMLLRSPRVASTISDPFGKRALEVYEESFGVPPVAPLPLETFVDYGRWFGQQLHSAVDPRRVAQIRKEDNSFLISLEDGSDLRSQRVVVAAGIGPFRRSPEVFRSLDGRHASHCYEGVPLAKFAGARVAVIGGGQSALESAALLRESGAEPEVIVKNSELKWVGVHVWLHHLGPLSDLLYSSHDVGPAGISRLVAMPNLVRRIPLSTRDKIRTRAVRPAGAVWLTDRLSEIRITTGRTVVEASSAGQEVRLRLDDGSERHVDHVLMGTGYSVDIERYSFLSPQLLGGIETRDGYPLLRRGFRSSVPGLHFVGATAARTFGPLLYFVAGTDFASRELSRLVRTDTDA